MTTNAMIPESASDSGNSSDLQEKSHALHSEHAPNGTDRGPIFDDKATTRLLRKIDIRLIPFLALLYLLSFLDRTNIGNARLAGLETDLGMRGLQYNHALAIFFPFYVIVEVPSNMMMKRTRPACGSRSS